MSRRLHVVAYHYVRDLANTPFPQIKGMRTDDFKAQVLALRHRYEMATLETALAFLEGSHEPSRDLCLLTFDDGLKEHGAEVAPFLAECGIQGVFFVITSCLEERRVAAVHMSHFLMASLGFERYRDLFMAALHRLPAGSRADALVDATQAIRTYRWDSPDVASFKYLLNFCLDWTIRDQLVQTLFVEHVSPEAPFAESLYVSWDEARHMQAMGMVVGGHSHRHKPLGLLSKDECDDDLGVCRDLLVTRLGQKASASFCYPYGNAQAFNDDVIAALKGLGFTCAFTTAAGDNSPGADRFVLRRVDCNDVDSSTGEAQYRVASSDSNFDCAQR
jgi:peptidoglycan/xylan/chitin deacetylase (PgdA/CDA1 family)